MIGAALVACSFQVYAQAPIDVKILGVTFI